MELNYDFMIQSFGLVLQGIPVTIALTAVSLVAAAPFAFLLALARIYKLRFFDKVAAVYISFVRGTPMILQILVVYTLVPSFLNYLAKSATIPVNVFAINPIIYAYIVFTLNTIALLAEIFRSALLSVDNGQIEAGLAIGLTSRQVYSKIVMPQALVSAVPNMCNITVNLLKNTSLAFLMTVKDVTAEGRIAASYGYNYIEAYIDVFIVYIILCTIVQVSFELAEKYIGSYRQLRRE